jgi:hypothetical protein
VADYLRFLWGTGRFVALDLAGSAGRWALASCPEALALFHRLTHGLLAMPDAKPAPVELVDDAGFLYYTEAGRTYHVGYLIDAGRRGVLDADLGRLPVSPEAAATHNRLLSAAEIAGLATCGVGQGRSFVLAQEADDWVVRTWAGDLVSARALIGATKARFTRDGRTFVGDVTGHKSGQLVPFVREA